MAEGDYLPRSGRTLREGDGETDTPINLGNAAVAKGLRGIYVVVSGSPVQAHADFPCTHAWVQAAYTSGTLTVGGAEGQTHELIAGAAVDLPIDNLNKVYINGTGTAHVTPFW